MLCERVHEEDEKTSYGVGEDICTPISNKDLASRINRKKSPKIAIRKWPKDINRYFALEDGQMANKHMKSIIDHWGNANESHNGGGADEHHGTTTGLSQWLT